MATLRSIFNHEVPDDTHDHYDVSFFDDTIFTVVTNTPSIVDQWISDIEHVHRHRLHLLVVGLYLSWRPNRRNQVHPVATLQLCVGRRCLIYQILHSPTIPSSLIDFLLNPSYTFVGAGIGDDVRKLKEDYNLDVARTADLRTLAMELGRTDLGNAGLKGLSRTVLGKELIKQKIITKSRWDNRRLTPAQVEYACIDTYLSFEIGRILISGKNNS